MIEETAPETVLLRSRGCLPPGDPAANCCGRPDRTVDVLLDLFKQDWVRTYKGTSLKVNSSGSESDTGRTEMKRSYGGSIYTAQITAADALGCMGKKANRPDVLKVLRGALNEEGKGTPASRQGGGGPDRPAEPAALFRRPRLDWLDWFISGP